VTIIARGNLVRRQRVGPAGFLPPVLVDLHLSDGFLAPLTEALAPCDRLAALPRSVSGCHRRVTAATN
jgi:hypothetical protein